MISQKVNNNKNNYSMIGIGKLIHVRGDTYEGE